MFTTKYRPQKIENFIGNKTLIQAFIRWLLEWNSDDIKNKCALISGANGIGKSLLVDLVLKKHDYHTIHLTLDDDRNRDYMNKVIKQVIKTKKTYDGQEIVLVVSDIDCGSDYGFISSLTECIKESSIPIICICDNKYDQSIKPILNYCFDIKMTKPSFKEVYVLLYNVVINEKIRIKETELKELYEESNGDIRFILNTLQMGIRVSKKNIQNSNIFETTGKILSMDENLDSKYETFWLSNDLHPLMIQENYINNTLNVSDQIRKLDNLSYSAHTISDMDLFESYVNMTNWEIEPYVAVNCIKAASRCNKKYMVKFPQFLGKISTINKNKKDKLNYENVEFFEKQKPKPKPRQKKTK
jgi:replication factor C subunit 1